MAASASGFLASCEWPAACSSGKDSFTVRVFGRQTLLLFVTDMVSSKVPSNARNARGQHLSIQLRCSHLSPE